MAIGELLHIHRFPGDRCIACNDADDGTRLFLTDPGYWNQLASRCDLTVMVRSDFVLFSRDDQNTSALLLEGLPQPHGGALPVAPSTRYHLLLEDGSLLLLEDGSAFSLEVNT